MVMATMYTCQRCQEPKCRDGYRSYKATGTRDKICRQCRNHESKAWKQKVSYKTHRHIPRRMGKPLAWPPDKLPIDICTSRRIMAAVIHQAVEHMQATRPSPRPTTSQEHRETVTREWRRNRADATCWLASSRATLFFEGVDFDQAACLSRLRWCDYAKVVRKDAAKNGPPLPADWDRVLRAGLNYFGGGD